MTELMAELINAFTGNMSGLIGVALATLRTLIIIDIVWSVITNFEQDYFKTLPIKIIKYGIWIWLIGSYSSILEQTTAFFINCGSLAAGGGSGLDLLKDPMKYIYDAIQELESLQQQTTMFDISAAVGNWIIWLVAFTGYALVSFQIFITLLEYYIITTLAVCLLPFGVFPRTAFIAEKAIGAILAFSIKLMVLSFIASVCIPLLSEINMDGGSFAGICVYAIKVLSIGYLVWQAPGVASGMLSGQPTLSGGGAVAAAGGYVAGRGKAAAGSAAQTATNVAKSAGSAMVGNVVSAAKHAYKAASSAFK